MKGRQLTLDEVLKLDDGTFIWIEDLSTDEFSGTHRFNKEKMKLFDNDNKFYTLDEDEEYYSDLIFYEWINIDTIMESKELPYPNSTQQSIYNMSVEICNLRGINLTDDNIDKVMKEFA